MFLKITHRLKNHMPKLTWPKVYTSQWSSGLNSVSEAEEFGSHWIRILSEVWFDWKMFNLTVWMSAYKDLA